MKICITSKGDTLESRVDSSFGKCEYFFFYETDSGDFRAVENPYKDKPKCAELYAAVFMKDERVDVVITGSEILFSFIYPLKKLDMDIVPALAGKKVRNAIEDFEHKKDWAKPVNMIEKGTQV